MSHSPVNIVYTYVQRPGCKKVNTATYVHTGGVSNAYSRILTTRACVQGWVRTEKLRRRRVHGEATGWVRTECVVVFIGSQPAWTEQPMETRPGVPQNGGNGLVFDRLWSKRGSCSLGGVWRTTKRDSTGYCSSPPSTPSSLHGLLFIHRRPPPASTCDCSSTGSCSSSLHRALLHRLLFNQPSPRAPVQPPLHGLLFILPSTIYCSSCPP